MTKKKNKQKIVNALRFAFVGAASAAKVLSSALKDLLQVVDSSIVGAALAANLFYSALKDLLQKSVEGRRLCGRRPYSLDSNLPDFRHNLSNDQTGCLGKVR